MNNLSDARLKIQHRYTMESENSCNLSCGSNLSFLDLQDGERILDLGCGRGEETIKAAMLVGPQGLAVGLDLTPSMLDVAHRNAEGIGIENIKFILGNIEEIPYSQEFFHAVISNCVINHAKSKEKVYGEIFRVLKTGGKFVISDAVTKNPLPQEIKDDPEAVAQCFGGAVTEKEYLDSISSAGFQDIKILKRREYVKNGYDFISLTLIAFKKT